MSHEATDWAMSQPGLKPATKIVLWVLARHDNPTHGCFPRHDTIAEEAVMSPRSVREHLDILEDLGLIERERDHRVGGEFASTRYTLRLDRQNTRPTAEFADGETCTDRRQISPTNPVRENPVRGGGGRAREGQPHVVPIEPAFMSRLLTTMGAEPGGLMLGKLTDGITAARWLENLSEDDCVQVVTEVMKTKRDGPPHVFSYFDKAMKRLIDTKAGAAEPLPSTPSRRRAHHASFADNDWSLGEQLATDHGAMGDPAPEGHVLSWLREEG